MAWRAGKTGLLQSPLTRAVIFGAMTNAVAFESMWSSNYPGMSSMGKDDGSRTTLHDGRCRAVSAGLDGPAAPNQDALTVSSSAVRTGIMRG
jgi:hypothetical protein